MKKMGRYCKAYPVKQFRQFSQWSEQLQNTRLDSSDTDNQQPKIPRRLTEDDFLYLQENYVVTDDIFLDENVIFDSASPEWITFCTEILKFELPAHTAAEASTNEAVMTNQQSAEDQPEENLPE